MPWADDDDMDKIRTVEKYSDWVAGYIAYPTQTGIPDSTITGVLVEHYFAGGDGSEDYPFLVHNPMALRCVGHWKFYDQGYYFLQIDDIDMGTNSDFFPIGSTGADNEFATSGTPGFKGHYNGDGYRISNLTFIPSSGEDYGGVFGFLDSGTIQNMVVEAANIKGSLDYAGALVGKISGDGAIIQNCRVIRPDVQSSNSGSAIGGVVGSVEAATTIEATSVEGASLEGSARYAGAVAGKITAMATIQDCRVTGSTVKSTNSGYFGGVVGNISAAATVRRCLVINTTVYSNGNGYVGGVVGYMSAGEVTQCGVGYVKLQSNITGGIGFIVGEKSGGSASDNTRGVACQKNGAWDLN